MSKNLGIAIFIGVSIFAFCLVMVIMKRTSRLCEEKGFGVALIVCLPLSVLIVGGYFGLCLLIFNLLNAS